MRTGSDSERNSGWRAFLASRARLQSEAMERWGWRLTLNLIGLYLAGLIVVALIVWIVLALFGKTEPPYN